MEPLIDNINVAYSVLYSKMKEIEMKIFSEPNSYILEFHHIGTEMECVYLLFQVNKSIYGKNELIKFFEEYKEYKFDEILHERIIFRAITYN